MRMSSVRLASGKTFGKVRLFAAGPADIRRSAARMRPDNRKSPAFVPGQIQLVRHLPHLYGDPGGRFRRSCLWGS